MKNFLFLLLAAVFLVGCGNKIQNIPPLPGTLPNFLAQSEKFDSDIYFDATVSMRGFTTLAADNVYITLPDLLGDLCGSSGKVSFFAFGEQIFPLDNRDYRKFMTPDVYNEPITAVSNVIERADSSHLSIIITDLFESDADWSNVTQKIRDKFFANHLSIAIIAIKNSFYGEIFDVGLNAAHFNYNSFDNPNRYRPFYILVLGSDHIVKNFLRNFNERQNLPNETAYLLLSENLTESVSDFSNFELDEVQNFYSDDTLGLNNAVKEFGLDNFSENASFILNWHYNPPLGACSVDLSQIDTQIEVFSADEDWIPRQNNDIRVSILKDDRQSENFLIKISLTPEKSLTEGKLNFIRIKIMPNERGYQLPQWINLWNMNIDASIKNFDGSKTANLNRILESLKNSIFSTSRPALLNINFVVTP